MRQNEKGGVLAWIEYNDKYDDWTIYEWDGKSTDLGVDIHPHGMVKRKDLEP
jgi:hypothetical protein